MADINARTFFSTIRDTYRRYLFTQNFISDSDSALRERFWQELEGRDVFCKEPLFSSIPAYQLDRSLRQLILDSSAVRLHRGLLRLNPAAFDVDRQLYLHQVRSIRMVHEGRNVAVASGTGSGKTECFLIPLLDDALRNPGPGVRAIVIYPMNALANDQLGRMRGLLKGLPDITFGRYTGDTPHDRADASEMDAREILDPNERFSRAEIRSAPPHLLLTNFAMLEYLLLRPQDSEIFTQQRLRYVVLDEAHTYNGAQGIDVGLLIRRLQLAFPRNQLQFVLTSATLGDDLQRVAGFAESLTGQPFTKDDVVLGVQTTGFAASLAPRVPLERYLAAVPDEGALNRWSQALGSAPALVRLIAETGLAQRAFLPESSPGALLWNWMVDNAELHRLHTLASCRPVILAEAAQDLFGESSDGALRIIEWLVMLGANAVRDSTSPPLLPSRFHFFLRGLRSGAVCVSRTCPARGSDTAQAWSRLTLDEALHCPDCQSPVIPLLTCVHCGTPVLRVFEADKKWFPYPTGLGQANAHLLSWVSTASQDEKLTPDDDAEPDAEHADEFAELCLSPACRILSVGAALEACCTSPNVVRLSRLNAGPAGILRQCPWCSGLARPYPSVLREVQTGEEASTAVLAEAIVRGLPDEDTKKPAAARRLLVFSDSRQRAAYFAPYLARTSAQTLVLKPLYQAICAAVALAGDEGATFDAIAEQYRRVALTLPYVVVRKGGGGEEYSVEVKRPGQLLPAEKNRLKTDARLALFENFTASPRIRNNIAGLGLAYVEVAFSDDERDDLGRRLEWMFRPNESNGWAALQALLWMFVWRKALELPPDVPMSDLAPGPEAVTYHNSEQGPLDGRLRWRWNPYYAKMPKAVVSRSGQAEVLAVLLGKDKLAAGDEIKTRLDQVWQALVESAVLSSLRPNEYQLSYDRLVIKLPTVGYLCNRCGSLTGRALKATCLMPGCRGHLSSITPQDLASRFSNHHWFHRVTMTDPLPLEVREHTAQLTNETGRKYQNLFAGGDVNVLSSSTTFEMGVDVGQLKSVFLRNVPPTPANYLQRAGRAGRRREGAAFAVTYARGIPHDQVHYSQPLDIVQGVVPVPRISLANPRLSQRHVNSFLLGSFLRSGRIPAPTEPRQMTASWFFGESADSGAAVRPFVDWVTERSQSLVPSLSRIIDSSCNLLPADAFQESTTGLVRCRERFHERVASYRSQYEELTREIAGATAQEAVELARSRESVDRLLDQLLAESLIDVLASDHWLPGYAFPQDVVRLVVRDPQVSQRMRLERDIEYGLAEYAPGAEVVADGLLLKSRAVDLQNRAMEVRYYRSCSRCNRVVTANTRQELQPICAYCQSPAAGPGSRPSAYAVPMGFTTHVADRAKPVNIYRSRPPRTSELFFMGGAPPEAFVTHQKLLGVSTAHLRNGELFRVNAGSNFEGFSLCPSCGLAIAQQKAHRKPWGARCVGGRLLRLHLACRFATDTLQVRFDAVTPPPPPVTDRDFWLSLQTAFLFAAADVLEIPARDLGGTFRSQSEGTLKGELIVFDRVPGGAGYVARLHDELPSVLGRALDRVTNCPNSACDRLGSCYSCLRSFGNQFEWNHLKRNVVHDWLSAILQ
ncbi:MAG TPA: DEAD/DEAH box helicase [Vicinamibacterales bacterium]|nr:DEAD/DEAH box helicase [Vicinamibacterales bacterium]